MSDDITANPPVSPGVPEHHGFLDKTFGEVIQNNPQAQDIIKNAMHIDQQKLQEMLHATGSNELMNMSIRDMFTNGIMQQAASSQTIQVTPEQIQQLNEAMQNNQGQVSSEQLQEITGINVTQGQSALSVEAPVQNPPSFFQKLKGLFG